MQQQTTHTHPFKSAGLGEAPFRFVGVTENALRMGDGTSRAGGMCDYCGTGIRYEYMVLSADNKQSKVGCDCVRKTGDAELITVIEAKKRELAKQQREAKRKAAYEAKLQAQRNKNNGLTNSELWAKREADEVAAKERAIAPILSKCEPLASSLQDGRRGFCDDIARLLRVGQLPTGRALAITCEILAKKEGRKNSKKYNLELERVSTYMEALRLEINSLNEGA